MVRSPIAAALHAYIHLIPIFLACALAAEISHKNYKLVCNGVCGMWRYRNNLDLAYRISSTAVD